MNHFKLFLLYIGFGVFMAAVFQNCSQRPMASTTTEKSSSVVEQEVITPDQIQISSSHESPILFGNNVILSISRPQRNVAYQWYFNDVPLIGENGVQLELPIISKAKMGTYTVRSGGTISNGIEVSVNWARSCKHMKEIAPSEKRDGSYEVNPSGDGHTLVSVYCLMSRKGGGWTRISFADAQNRYQGTYYSNSEGISMNVHPKNGISTYDGEGDSHARYQFRVPEAFAYTQFFLKDYFIKANSSADHTSEINGDEFAYNSWSSRPQNFHGDVAFGSPDENGPEVSYADHSEAFQGETTVFAFPFGEKAYSLSQRSLRFRIVWGESGPQEEGWFPWYSGHIFIR